MKTIALLGATGSIGRSTRQVVEAEPERFRLAVVTAQSDVEGLAEIARTARADLAVIGDERHLAHLRAALAGSGIATAGGRTALIEAAARPVDIVVSAIVGAAGLRPTTAAIAAGNRVALANKECLVCAGASFMRDAARIGVDVLPLDSEHNAVFQLIEGRGLDDIETVILTASGGPFRTASAEEIDRATPAAALRHPTWSMGAKISVDSATLMNKGLELIEAHHLFGLPPERLDVLVHPQSIVHALVRFRDGSLHAEMGAADMRRPIAHCLDWPTRSPTPRASLDLAAVGSLTFERPDVDRFPALRLAREALAHGKGAPTALNAANEVAVERFLNHMIGFNQIPWIVERTLDEAARRDLLAEPADVDEALLLDEAARAIAGEIADVLAIADASRHEKREGRFV